MSNDLNYDKLGLKCGIEIHQQLDTRKLFCNCKTDMEQSSIGKVTRKLNVVKGEMGQVDPAALHESLKDKVFVYKYYPEESCEVELDEEPPHEVNEEALNISLQMAKMMNCYVPNEIHTMRKTVIDGSNTSGFQRTMLVGVNGHITLNDKKIGIDNVCLEEESSQIIDKKGKTKIYGVNRLGIPLIEIGTEPAMRTPKEVKKVAKKIGNLLRSTRSVKRGIGTIRQDVNVSIEDGARIEIKGMQELDLIQKAVELEAERQKKLIEIKNTLNEKETKINKEVKDVKHIFEKSDSNIAEMLTDNDHVKSFKLEGFSGLLAKQISGNKTFGAELSDYVKSLGLGGIIHTDEDLEKYDLVEHFSELEELHNANDEDVIVVLSANEQMDDALKILFERIEKAYEKVPEETRIVQNDGTSKYARPLPGEARMYPETDVPPITITSEQLDNVAIPKTLQERIKELKKDYDLSEHLADEILESRFYDLFFELVDKTDLENKTIATVLTTDLKDIKKRENIDIDQITESKIEDILLKFNEGKISREAIKKIVIDHIKNKQELDELYDKYSEIDTDNLRKIIGDVIEERKNVLDDDRAFKKLMGPVMSKVQGKADGEKVAKLLKEEISKRN